MFSQKSLHLLHRLTLEEYLAMCKNNRRTYTLSFSLPQGWDGGIEIWDAGDEGHVHGGRRLPVAGTAATAGAGMWLQRQTGLMSLTYRRSCKNDLVKKEFHLFYIWKENLGSKNKCNKCSFLPFYVFCISSTCTWLLQGTVQWSKVLEMD